MSKQSNKSTNKSANKAAKGIYSLLNKKGIENQTVDKLIRKYGEEKINFTKKHPYNKYFTVECIQENFSSFLGIVTKETGVEFKKNQGRILEDDFHDGSYDGTVESVYPDWKD